MCKFRNRCSNQTKLIVRCDVNNQRIEPGPLLRFEHTSDSLPVERVRTEPINGFRWKCYKADLAEIKGYFALFKGDLPAAASAARTFGEQ